MFCHHGAWYDFWGYLPTEMRIEFINHQRKRIKKGNKALPIEINEVMIKKPKNIRMDNIIYFRDDSPLLL